jgi:hypothetical protein
MATCSPFACLNPFDPLLTTRHRSSPLNPLVTLPLLIPNLRTNGSPSPNPPLSMLQQTEPPLITHQSSPKRCAYNPESMTSSNRPPSWAMPSPILFPHPPCRYRSPSLPLRYRRPAHAFILVNVRPGTSSALVVCSHARLTATDMPHGVSVDHVPPPSRPE